MHRPTVALLAIVLLLTGTALWFVGGDVEDYQAWIAACWRVGAVLAALWLALPEMRRMPTWLLLAILVVAVLVARQPRAMILVFVAAVAYAYLRPRLQRWSAEVP